MESSIEFQRYANASFETIGEVKRIISSPVERDEFITNRIINKLYQNPNIIERYYQQNVISYLGYLIISGLTNHSHDMDAIDTFDSDGFGFSKLSKFVSIMSANKFPHISMTQGANKQVIMLLESYARSLNTFTIIKNMLAVLNDDQLLVLYFTKNEQGVSILEQLYMSDEDSCLNYFNGNFVNILPINNTNQEHKEEIDYLSQTYNQQEKCDYFHFAIVKLYMSGIGVMRAESHHLSTIQLQHLIRFITMIDMNVEERFKGFCNVLTHEQLLYVGV
jgi:hypothetical protein